MIWPPKGPKLDGSTAGPSMNVTPCAMVVVSARCVTCVLLLPVNRKEAAVLARYDHFVAKCAHFVERKRAVVRIGAAA